MADGLMLPPGAGRVIAGGGLHATLKVAGGSPAVASTFEVVVPPGFDVGAHVHRAGQELFYVLEGELDLLAFEPRSRTEGDWHGWVSSVRPLITGTVAFSVSSISRSCEVVRIMIAST